MTQALLLGCIADDFTGATDLANNLVRSGMRVLQINGLPKVELLLNVDAVVIALKSRTIPAADAIAQSLAALAWLQQHKAQQIYFKYCSTFDSTPQGNIGPVTEALMQALGTDFTIATPAFPDNGRTVFKGYLFAGDGLLSESGMQNHPLTPMKDANLVRVLQAQSVGQVGLVDYRSVMAGTAAISERFEVLQKQGARMAIVDAISNDDLMRLGASLAKMPLVTGGSGVAIGLAQNHGRMPAPCPQHPAIARLSLAVAHWPPMRRCNTSWELVTKHWRLIRSALLRAWMWWLKPWLGPPPCWARSPY
jgi:3-dehydrotetronate 4-kinase